MTRDTKRKAGVAGVGAAALLIVLGWVIPRGADAGISAVDARYVRSDTFRLFKERLRERALVDSLSSEAALREIQHILAGLDSSDRCRRGQRDYCR